MKKIMIVALAVFAQFANARSVLPVIVQLEDTPIRGFMPVESGEKTLIQILPGGAVMGTICEFDNSGIVRCGDSVEISKLSKFGMKRVQQLVKRAEVGAIISPDPFGPVCLAIPTRSEKITANSGSVLLESGSYPCGGVTINDTRAAEQLAQMMRNYKQKFDAFED